MRSILILSTSLLWALACSEEAKFRKQVDTKKGVADAGAAETLNFSLSVKNGEAVTKQELSSAKPLIKYKIRNAPLNADELAPWSVSIYPVGGAAPKGLAVTEQNVDLRSANGLTTVKADFTHSISKGAGLATAVIFVDGESPVPLLIRNSISDGGKSSAISWSASDNYKLDESKTELIACVTQDSSFSPENSAQIATLPADCMILYKGADLYAKGPNINLGELTISGNKIDAGNVRLGIYAEDAVGLGAFTWITDSGENLVLNAKPSGIIFTNKADYDVKLELLHITAVNTLSVHDEANKALWVNYDLSSASTAPGSVAEVKAFEPSLKVKIGPEEIPYGFELNATNKDSGLASNRQLVNLVYDITAPVIRGITVVIDKQVPSPDSNVSMAWAVVEKNEVVSQKIEIKSAEDANWATIGEIKGSDRTFVFPWGTRPLTKSFSIRITATDIAGNVGSNIKVWTRQIFNASILTSSVECFFCHTKVIGDVGGINFPASVRSDTGRNFEITGKIFGTNTVPPALASQAKGGSFSNYDNSGERIFPKDLKFPILTADELNQKVKGTLDTATVHVDNTFKGNLVLDGTLTNPILIHGEVFVEGDVVIKGKYRGVGTIYAKNIYIADDLTAVKSPYPFSEDSEAAGKQALAAVLRNDDALYLGALNQIVVGVAANRLQEPLGKPFLSDADYSALGRPAVWLKDTAGKNIDIRNSCCSPQGINDAIFKNEVNQVDAYLYAGKLVTWRAYANILLNGGFMAPKGSIISTVAEQVWVHKYPNLAPNPRTGLPVDKNLIRYDWRLRVGGAGFETLKERFND